MKGAPANQKPGRVNRLEALANQKRVFSKQHATVLMGETVAVKSDATVAESSPGRSKSWAILSKPHARRVLVSWGKTVDGPRRLTG